MSQPPYPPPPPGQPGYPPYGYPPAGPPPFQPPPRRGLSPVAIVLIVLAGCAVVAVLGVAIPAAVLFPVFSQAREKARAATCRSNVRQLSTALMIYAQDYDQRFPPAASWQDGIAVYHQNPAVDRCPSHSGSPSGYAFNSWMSGRPLASVDAPALQPVLFESSAGTRNAADALKTFDPRHRAGAQKVGSVGYVDGHVQAVGAAPPANGGLKSQR